MFWKASLSNIVPEQFVDGVICYIKTGCLFCGQDDRSKWPEKDHEDIGI